MISQKFVISIIFLHLVNCKIHLNLHLTKWLTNGGDHLHDCLYIPAHFPDEYDESLTLAYCMSEWPSKFQIQINPIDQVLTFAQLAKDKINTKQLYDWSAPMDLIEDYQIYLNQLILSFENTTFYNCTLPYFGSKCQYFLKAYDTSYSFVDEMIESYYQLNLYDPSLLTCYKHLQCNRGPSPACLDWTEIFDGKIDCFDGGLDEENCFLFHLCESNEYRCRDGPCIPIESYKEKQYEISFDCIDTSDEDDSIRDSRLSPISPIVEPTFAYEDISCRRHIIGSYWNTYFVESSCISQRLHLLSKAIFSMKPKLLSDECWTALECLLDIPLTNSAICRFFRLNNFYENIFRENCPNYIYMPSVPIYSGNAYLVFDKNDFRDPYSRLPIVKYICYDEQQIHILENSDIERILLNNQSCLFLKGILRGSDVYDQDLLAVYIYALRKKVLLNSIIFDNQLKINDSSMIYQCQNTTTLISKHRLKDSFQDCLYGDDENEFVLNETYVKKIKSHPYNLIESKEKTLFQSICDGEFDYQRVYIGNLLVSDETNCENWPIIHIYNRCDGYWHLDDGSDEINCELLPRLINCSHNQYICVSRQTNQLICLPIEKTNDGIIDCLGAIDEADKCRKQSLFRYRYTVFCDSNDEGICAPSDFICGRNTQSISTMYAEGCKEFSRIPSKRSVRTIDNYNSIDCSNVTKFFCEQYSHKKLDTTAYFILDRQVSLPDTQIQKIYVQNKITQETKQSYQQRCHRGLDVDVYLDKTKNITTNVCLCPPSYYGQTCQYQNQRVSLTLQFVALADSAYTPFIISVSLIDTTSNERLIHSNEQFIYLSSEYCRKKFHIYLLYSTRPKDIQKQYAIHIDIYQQIDLEYRTSFIKLINYPFLPVHRLVYLLEIPSKYDTIQYCHHRYCQHGKCIQIGNESFCQCQHGWFGESCSIPYNCECSSDALCLGRLVNNRSLCICPLHQMGAKCLIENQICENQTCSNRGQCIPLNGNFKWKCMCKDMSSGEQCQLSASKIIVSFDKNIDLTSTILIHFITIQNMNPPKRTTTFKKLFVSQRSFIIRWSLPFHLVFLEINKKYFLTLMQKIYIESSIITTHVQLSHKCLSINHLFNESFTKLHIFQRIKYYHLPCQESIELSCFYDDMHLCLCQQINQNRVANCFEFDREQQSICPQRNLCQNDGKCYQENSICSRITHCQCESCFHGSFCELNTHVYSLSLDAILAFRILPNVNLTNQPSTVIISLVITIIIVILGLINGTLSLITFKNASTRESGCGIYLLCSSMITILIMFFFLFKYLIVLLSQIGLITNYSFLIVQCYPSDFLLKSSFIIEQWLTAFVSIERATITIQGFQFKKTQAKFIAKWVICISIVVTIVTNIHDPLYRELFKENDYEEQRYWCTVNYSTDFLRIYNMIIHIIHFICPFLINLISAIIIIVVKTRTQIALDKRQQTNQRRKILFKQIQQHRNLLIGPCVLTILGIPRLITSFTTSCMKSMNDFWFFLLGYYISLIPSSLTFILFVLPSSTYKQAFKKAMTRYRKVFF